MYAFLVSRIEIGEQEWKFSIPKIVKFSKVGDNVYCKKIKTKTFYYPEYSVLYLDPTGLTEEEKHLVLKNRIETRSWEFDQSLFCKEKTIEEELENDRNIIK